MSSENGSGNGHASPFNPPGPDAWRRIDPRDAEGTIQWARAWYPVLIVMRDDVAATRAEVTVMRGELTAQGAVQEKMHTLLQRVVTELLDVRASSIPGLKRSPSWAVLLGVAIGAVLTGITAWGCK